MFRPRSSKSVANNKMSPVLKQIMNKKVQSEQGNQIAALSVTIKATVYPYVLPSSPSVFLPRVVTNVGYTQLKEYFKCL